MSIAQRGFLLCNRDFLLDGHRCGSRTALREQNALHNKITPAAADTANDALLPDLLVVSAVALPRELGYLPKAIIPHSGP